MARLRNEWVLEDRHRERVAVIREHKLSVRDEIKIDLGGRTAKVKKSLVGLRDRFHIDVEHGDDMKAHGNILDHEYEIECDGELHGDAALEPNIRNAYMADSTLTGSANLLICPNLDAANILYNVLKTTTSGGVTVGPVLMGGAGTAYILTPAGTVRRVLNMTALAAAAVHTAA